MKTSHILLCIISITATQLPINAMEQDDGYQPKSRIAPLTQIVTKYIADRIDSSVKQCLSANYATEEIVGIVLPWLSPLTQPTLDMIRINLLHRYANKVFERTASGNTQYYDGRQLSKAERLNPIDPQKIDSNGYGSLWSGLAIEQLITKYCTIHKAHKQREFHPFSVLRNDEEKDF